MFRMFLLITVLALSSVAMYGQKLVVEVDTQGGQLLQQIEPKGCCRITKRSRGYWPPCNRTTSKRLNTVAYSKAARRSSAWIRSESRRPIIV